MQIPGNYPRCDSDRVKAESRFTTFLIGAAFIFFGFLMFVMYPGIATLVLGGLAALFGLAAAASSFTGKQWSCEKCGKPFNADESLAPGSGRESSEPEKT